MVRGSSWGERISGVPELENNFLEKCGAKASSKDVHWPMTLSIRAPTVAPDGAQLRGPGLRQRSAKAVAARKAKNNRSASTRPKAAPAAQAGRPLQRLSQRRRPLQRLGAQAVGTQAVGAQAVGAGAQAVRAGAGAGDGDVSGPRLSM